MSTSPCTSCGACCAFFRVSFFWGECQSSGGTVPDDTVELVTPSLVAMRGTSQPNPRCTKLAGEIGEDVRCTMYEQRSSSCRDFDASWENGEHNPRCDDARAKHGLPPLSPQPVINHIPVLQLRS
ncbi:YkgJ family cysteine cluster protein [Pseudomonas serbica]|uniref:YkgJ family cysteine cluster protein n=1 Tax=Pseudomonas serbica TaxID=2965074 RepID=UPI00237C5223|nr:YkgJ family cysteine cluster protein [Pseudomonas serbica]